MFIGLNGNLDPDPGPNIGWIQHKDHSNAQSADLIVVMSLLTGRLIVNTIPLDPRAGN